MQRSPLRSLKYAIHILYCVLFLFLAGCAAQSAPTPFIAPFTRQLTPTVTATAQVTSTFTPPAGETPTPTATAASELSLQASPTVQQLLPTATADLGSPTPKTCSDSLVYIADVNYPDDSPVTPGQAINKQWRVKNNGTCDWDQGYHLKLVDGYPALGAESVQALFPARAGTQAVISINFSAPPDAGSYRTAWQANSPEGTPFGDVIYMIVIVGQ